MKTRHALTSVVSVIVSLAALAGCTTASAPAAQTSSPASAVAALKASGVLKVATEGTYSPFTFHDTSGTLTGYDIEVITAVADKLGVKPEFSETKWDSIFAGLDAKRYDVIANEVSINDARKAKYDLTSSYSVSYPVVIVKADNQTITSTATISGKKTAQTATSNWADYARKAGATVVPVEGFTEAVSAVKDGRVDATFNDNLAALDFFNTTGNTAVKIGYEIPTEKVNQAFALRKDSGLADAFNQALADLVSDGTLAKIGQKWFGKDISK